MDFTSRANALYAEQPHNILPFVGAGFEAPLPGDLRMVVVGLNAYYSARHWPPDPERAPADWSRRFRERDGRFFTAARNLASELADALAPSPDFAGLTLRNPEGLYGTNAVKSWVLDGKRSSRVEPETLVPGAGVWRNEIELMAEHDVLPHVILVLAERFWGSACRSLRTPPAGLRVSEHQSTLSLGRGETPCLHLVNRYVVQGSGEPQPLLLVRLFHPSAPKRKDSSGLPRGTVRWLASQPDFRAVANLPEVPGATESAR
jgi:hypothetical protein